MNPRKFTIYCHTNKVNGKPYVGQTVDSMEGRWKEHLSAAKKNRGSRIFGHAIRKYGPDAFGHEVLDVVDTQAEADLAEVKWIGLKKSRSPHGYNLALGGGGPGYHHEDSKALIAESSKRRILEMSFEQRAAFFAKNIHRWTPDRRAAMTALAQSPEMREKVAIGQRAFWSGFSIEERSARVRHQLAGMSVEEKSGRTKKAWTNLTPEARAERVENARAGITPAGSAVRSAKLSAYQTARQASLTAEQKREIAAKSVSTRRARYDGRLSPRVKPSAEYSEATRRGWANMTPEARAERVQKVQDGRRRARLARQKLDAELIPFARHWISKGHSVDLVASTFNVSIAEIDRAVA